MAAVAGEQFEMVRYLIEEHHASVNFVSVRNSSSIVYMALIILSLPLVENWHYTNDHSNNYGKL